MKKYFSIIENIADTDTTQYSLKDLTLKLMQDAGYKRTLVTDEKSKVHNVVTYERPFDTILTAKWLMEFKKLFFSVLGKHPEFGDSNVSIITDSFLHLFRYLDINNVRTDKDVRNLFMVSLRNRIAQKLIDMGSQTRVDSFNTAQSSGENMYEYKKQSHNKVNMVATATEYVSDFEDFDRFDYNDYVDSINNKQLLIEIRRRIKGNPYGERVLEGMMYSNAKFYPSNICKYIKLKGSEINPQTLSLIRKAYKTIVTAVCDYENIDIPESFEKCHVKFGNVEDLCQ